VKPFDSVKLTAAKSKDALFFLKVRNQTSVRAASFQTAVIEKESHLKWYRQALLNPQTALFIIWKGMTPAGTLRLNRMGSDKAEVHLALLDSMRRQGAGTAAVQAAVKWVAAQKVWKVKQVLAHIKKENKASVRCFEKAGFQLCGSTRINGEKCLRFAFKYFNFLTLVDAGRVSGLGHLMRQNALAHELSARGHRITFGIRHLPQDRKNLKKFFMDIKNSNINWHPGNPNIRTQINLCRPDAVIWDALAFDVYDWSRSVRKSGLPVFAVGNYPSLPGWIRYCVNPYTRTKLSSHKSKLESSPAYCVLSDEFVHARSVIKKRLFKSAGKSGLLIIPGGGNTNGMIFKIVKALETIPAAVRVTIVCGAFFTEIEKLKSEIKKLKCRIDIEQNISSSEMTQLMLKNDLALVSYGRSIDEARALGLPVLILSSSPLNALGAKHAEKQGGVKYLGDFDRLKVPQISAAISGWLNSPPMRRKLSESGMTAVDGAGCVRTADWIEKELTLL